MPKKNQELTWKNSKAKKLLEEDLISGAIPLDSKDMGPKDVYRQRSEFAVFAYAQFRDRLRDLRWKTKDRNDLATSDSTALAHDQQIYPKAMHNHRGKPRWEGSEMERLLRLDMDAGKHKHMEPIELYHSRKVYYDNYPLIVSRKHIDQEERHRKFLAYHAGKNKHPT